MQQVSTYEKSFEEYIFVKDKRKKIITNGNTKNRANDADYKKKKKSYNIVREYYVT